MSNFLGPMNKITNSNSYILLNFDLDECFTITSFRVKVFHENGISPIIRNDGTIF